MSTLQEICEGLPHGFMAVVKPAIMFNAWPESVPAQHLMAVVKGIWALRLVKPH